MYATRLKTWAGAIAAPAVLLFGALWLTSSLEGKPNRKGPFNITVPKISTDPTIKYDYDIVYVRTPRTWKDHTALPGLRPGALPAAGRQGDVHQQPQRLRDAAWQ